MAGENKKSETAEPYSVSSNDSRPKRAVGDDSWMNIRVPRPRVPKVVVPSSVKRWATGGALAALVLGLVAGFAGGVIGANVHNNGSLASGGLSSQKKVVTSQSQLISQIAKTVGPSVVSVDVISQTSGGTRSAFDEFFDNGGGDNSGQTESAGTGIIINSAGLIITNRHVVPAGTTSVSVTLSDGTELKDVQVLGRTSDSDTLDIAFLKITNTEGHKLTPAVIGSSSRVQVGDSVVAIGNALGQFQNTVTSGIISGFGRQVQAGDSDGSSSEDLDDLFQTDAAINEGNSGGPLVNLNGQVIGINTAIASNSQNVGFAIPIDDVTGLIKQVEQTGKLQRPYLGVRYVALTPDIAKQYNLNVDHGAFVVPADDPDSSGSSVITGSAADKAGVEASDVITKIDSSTIDSTHSLTSIIDKHSVGDKVNLTVVRGGKTIHLTATLEAAPSS